MNSHARKPMPVQAKRAPVRPVVEELDYPSDIVLVVRMLDGDNWACEATYRRYGGQIRGLLTRLLGSREEARWALRDTFLLAFQRLDRLRNPHALLAWLRRVAVRQAHARLWRRRVRRWFGMKGPRRDASLLLLADHSCNTEQLAELRLLGTRLDRLAPKDRIAFMLHYVEGLSIDEIATMCACATSTVRKWIRHAFKVTGLNLSKARYSLVEPSKPPPVPKAVPKRKRK